MIDTAHTSIREPQSVARLSCTFSRSLSAVVESGTRGEHACEFHRDEVLGESASLAVVLGVLATAEQVFIEWRGEVAAVIARRDLQKPPLRVWLFDANLTWAVGELFPNDAWQSQITPGRLEKAVALRAERQRRGSECALLDCLQVKDKADILVSDSASLAMHGLASRREAGRLTRRNSKANTSLPPRVLHSSSTPSSAPKTSGASSPCVAPARRSHNTTIP